MKNPASPRHAIRIMELRGTYKGGGGPDKTILLSAKYHDERFFVLVTYLRSREDNEFQIGEKAKVLGLKHYVEVLDRGVLDFICLYQLSSLIRDHKIQIVHVHDLKTTLLGVLLKVLHPHLKIMHTAHGWIAHSRSDQLKHALQAWLLRFYPFHIAVSKTTRWTLINFGIPAQSIQLLYNAIDLDYWQRNGGYSTVRKEFGIKDSSFIVGSIGRLSPEKDLPTLLQVAHRVLQRNPDCTFIIAGDGKQDEVTYYRKLAKELAIDKSVILAGHRQDAKNLYLSFDLFLMTSLTEGLPNVALEAMAMGVPVVATSVGGVPELVIDQETGFLCQPKDVDGIAEAVNELIVNKRMRKKFAYHARERIANNFAFEARLAKIEAFYQDLACQCDSEPVTE